ncbi:hypothetical protein, partial [Rhizobium hidalgonense]|uniref:hypothetical protein n=1 Tax=Rhizobium hidalgonense TaxID=1538159 RepID=UPI002871C638
MPASIDSAAAMKRWQKRRRLNCTAQEFGEKATPNSVIPGLDPLLSGLNLVDKAHGVDSTRIRMFGD